MAFEKLNEMQFKEMLTSLLKLDRNNLGLDAVSAVYRNEEKKTDE